MIMQINDEPFIRISLSQQDLTLIGDNIPIARFPVSTATNGPGERFGSECTPRGWHRICAKIGAGRPINTVFRGRRPTGEIYGQTLGKKYPGRDWILTRILWLSGLEPGKNRFHEVDTMRRYIYIHGSPGNMKMGMPGSRGCIRMHNPDIIDLFDHVLRGTRVRIVE
uniref:L,D-transpeptidase catalytic domain n=1 Tax=Candidatus Kentrum sp. SD TaxID=2126332 RepID=A0A450Z600_9GAMM|nr:MAG: L,D-transpeptidase catalytic domain [Candidatus Kentron sp. SD]VFK49216.1 MAG: L,D-transpeptidase catalytic domain [Candidatus Kentron sp. SD]VFK80813.1 MAG: L,D-transpeptidase catalytic domain [Candidatus Kentron sp. SD]